MKTIDNNTQILFNALNCKEHSKEIINISGENFSYSFENNEFTKKTMLKELNQKISANCSINFNKTDIKRNSQQYQYFIVSLWEYKFDLNKILAILNDLIALNNEYHTLLMNKSLKWDDYEKKSNNINSKKYILHKKLKSFNLPSGITNHLFNSPSVCYSLLSMFKNHFSKI